MIETRIRDISEAGINVIVSGGKIRYQITNRLCFASPQASL